MTVFATNSIDSSVNADHCLLIGMLGLFFRGLTLYQHYFSYLTATVHKSIFYGLFFNQFLTSSLSWHWRVSGTAIPINPERQGGKPLLVFKTLICCGRGSNPRPPAHEVDALTTRPPWRDGQVGKQPVAWKDYWYQKFYKMFSGHKDVTEIVLKMTWLNTLLSVNPVTVMFSTRSFELRFFVNFLSQNNYGKEGFWKHCGKRRKCW